MYTICTYTHKYFGLMESKWMPYESSLARNNLKGIISVFKWRLVHIH